MGFLKDVLSRIEENMTPVSHGEEPGSQSFPLVCLDPWRLQSGSDLLLHKHFETVVFETFFFVGEGKAKENKITNKTLVPKANVVCEQLSVHDGGRFM